MLCTAHVQNTRLRAFNKVSVEQKAFLDSQLMLLATVPYHWLIYLSHNRSSYQTLQLEAQDNSNLYLEFFSNKLTGFFVCNNCKQLRSLVITA